MNKLPVSKMNKRLTRMRAKRFVIEKNPTVMINQEDFIINGIVPNLKYIETAVNGEVHDSSSSRFGRIACDSCGQSNNLEKFLHINETDEDVCMECAWKIKGSFTKWCYQYTESTNNDVTCKKNGCNSNPQVDYFGIQSNTVNFVLCRCCRDAIQVEVVERLKQQNI